MVKEGVATMNSYNVEETSTTRRLSLVAKAGVIVLCFTAMLVISNSVGPTYDDADEMVHQSAYRTLPNAPAGTAGNDFDDGDTDADDYNYDPLHGDDPNDPSDSMPDVEGQAPPTPKWHACRFQAKSGGVYDLRPLMRLARTLEEDWVHRDAIHRNTTYFLNVCANTMAIPPACRKLAKKDKSPAYQVRCYECRGATC